MLVVVLFCVSDFGVFTMNVKFTYGTPSFFLACLRFDVFPQIQEENDLQRILNADDSDASNAVEKTETASISSSLASSSSSRKGKKPQLLDRPVLIRSARNEAVQNLESQAKRMKVNSDNTRPPAHIGDNVTIPIPDVDKGKGDLHNIVGVIIDADCDAGLYKIGTKHGVLNKQYSRTEFDLCAQVFITKKYKLVDNVLSLRTAATKHSVGTGQTKCSTSRCKCKREKRLCSSKCHGSMTCSNK